MADSRMSVEERESFLADVHIGVLSIPRKERAAPLTVPVWYDYEPGGEAWLITGQQSLKGRLLEVGTPVALVAQTEDTPYKYVSVEGRVSAIEPTSNEATSNPWRYVILANRGVSPMRRAVPRKRPYVCRSYPSAGSRWITRSPELPSKVLDLVGLGRTPVGHILVTLI